MGAKQLTAAIDELGGKAKDVTGGVLNLTTTVKELGDATSSSAKNTQELVSTVNSLHDSAESAHGTVSQMASSVSTLHTNATAAIAALVALTESGDRAAIALSKARHETDQCSKSLQIFTDVAGSAMDVMARARAEAGHMGEALAESGTAAARNAIAITQMTTSIYDANPAIKELLGNLDGIVKTAPTLAIYMNDLVNRFKDGQISGDQLNQAVQALKSGLDNLNSIGGGFMGDIDTKFSGILKTVQELIDTIGKGKK